MSNQQMALDFHAMSQISIDELRQHNLLQPFVRCQVIAAAVADGQVDPDAIQQARNDFIRDNGLSSEEGLESFLIDRGLSEENFKWQISLPLLIRLHCKEHFLHKAEAHFLKRKNQLDQVIYSLLRVKDPFLARELYLRIEAGEASFADLAIQYAQGPERDTAGRIGPVSLTQAHPRLAEKLRIATPGILLNPFKIGEWWIVLLLVSYTSAVFDERMAERMAEELFNQWVQEETSIKIKALRPVGSDLNSK